MPRERIDRDWIARHAGTVLELHLNMGREHRMVRRVVDKRTGMGVGLSYTDVSHKRTAKRPARNERWWHVATHGDPVSTLDEALEILAIVRAADDPETQAGSGSRPDATPLPISDAPAVAPAGAVTRKPETAHA